MDRVAVDFCFWSFSRILFIGNVVVSGSTVVVLRAPQNVLPLSLPQCYIRIFYCLCYIVLHTVV